MSDQIDPITRSVIQHRLTAIVEEMGEAMLRTSYSQILNASRDFSIGMLDRHCRLIAQADERFRALHLDWHAAQTRVLL